MLQEDADTSSEYPTDDTPSNWAEIGVARRHHRLERRRRRNKRIALGLAAGVLVVGVLAGGAAWGHRLTGDSPVGFVPTRSSENKNLPVVKPTAPVAEPTPYFAQHGSVKLRLPVAVNDLTEVGFHQAAYRYAVKLSTKLPDADSAKAKKEGGTGRDKASQAESADAWLIGNVLRMWRSRPGKPNTAADVGAKAGTQVVSPVDGTVLLVKQYDLYGKDADYELHIRPDDGPTLDLVMIHIEDPVVKAGDRVSAGITPLGKIRKLSDRIKHQLAHYTGEAGNHTHLQLNDTTDPKYKGLKDAPVLPAN